MKLSLGLFSIYFLSFTAAARDLSIVKSEGHNVVIKAKGTDDTLWYSLNFKNGVPSFEVKGSKKDEEASAKADLMLSMETVKEDGDNGKKLSFEGMESYWGSIGVEKDVNRIALRASMYHPEEKDIAGNYYIVLLEAVIDKNSDGFVIRPMIQNFPFSYGRSNSRGYLTVSQSIITQPKEGSISSNSNGIITAGDFGHVDIISDSGIEDGNPGMIPSPTISKGTRLKAIISDSKQFQVEFNTRRPKNATFVEHLIFNPQAISIVDSMAKNEGKDDKVKAQNKNAATSVAVTSLVTLITSAAVAVILNIL